MYKERVCPQTRFKKKANLKYSQLKTCRFYIILSKHVLSVVCVCAAEVALHCADRSLRRVVCWLWVLHTISVLCHGCWVLVGCWHRSPLIKVPSKFYISNIISSLMADDTIRKPHMQLPTCSEVLCTYHFKTCVALLAWKHWHQPCVAILLGKYFPLKRSGSSCLLMSTTTEVCRL